MKKIILIAILFCSINASAQNDPQKIIDEFFKLYKEKNAETALDYVFGTNKWMVESKDQIDNLKFRLINTSKRLGDFHSYKIITRKGIGDTISLYSFIVKYDRQPLRFTFIFYRPEEHWRLQNFIFDDAFEDELKEAAKSYRLNENIDR